MLRYDSWAKKRPFFSWRCAEKVDDSTWCESYKRDHWIALFAAFQHRPSILFYSAFCDDEKPVQLVFELKLYYIKLSCIYKCNRCTYIALNYTYRAFSRLTLVYYRYHVSVWFKTWDGDTSAERCWWRHTPCLLWLTGIRSSATRIWSQRSAGRLNVLNWAICAQQ